MCGYTVPDKRLIQISTEECPTEALAESTLLHETLHAILASTGMARVLAEAARPFNKDDPDWLEEALVDALESGLSSLKDKE